jgi:hypothetical protein
MTGASRRLGTENRYRWPTATPGCPDCGDNDSGLYTDGSPGKGSDWICWRCRTTWIDGDGILGIE